jgi:PAS domain S-box-containing protein
MLEIKIRNLIEGAADAMVLIDRAGRIEMLNAKSERLFGYDRAELLGQTVEVLVPQRFRHSHASLRAGYAAQPMPRPMGIGRDLFALRKDGGEIAVEISLNPIETEAGMMVLATIADITERQRIVTALRLSEERFRSIFGAVSEGIFIVDAPTGAFLEVNEPGAAMFGYAPGELDGRTIASLSTGVAPYTQQDAVAWIEKAASTGRPQHFDWHCRAKDGRQFWSEIAIRFARIDNRDVVLAVARDITRRRAVEAQLQQSQKMEAIGNLTGGLAHDFNNLLGVIIGNLDLLHDRIADADTAELVQEALDAAQRGADLNRRLLAFARRQPLQLQLIDVNRLVGGITQLLARVLGEAIEVVVEPAPNLWSVTADPAQLEAAIANLATNARDAMPGGGRLLITTRNARLDEDYAQSHVEVAAGDYVLIEVSDSGSGIEPAILGRIFEPFFTTKEPGKGTGLGLSMVFGFMRQSGGHVNVYSEPGKGTIFRLYLPRSTAGAPAREACSERPARGGGETILVVEDNAALLRVVVKQLKELGYHVIAAESAAAALAALDDGVRIDLLFTDIVMPGGFDGVQLAQEAQTRRAGLKLLLTSGFPEARLPERGRAAAARLLSKPYTRSELARVVRGVLDG